MESTVLTILSASIAAIISAGAFFTNAWLQRRHEVKLRRDDKYQEMAWLVHEAEAWLLGIESHTRNDASLVNEYPRAAAKALVIAGIYFKKDFYKIIRNLKDELEGYREYLAHFQLRAELDEKASAAAVRLEPQKSAELRQTLHIMFVMIHQEIGHKAVPRILL